MAVQKRILAFAREPGGAETIAPVVAKLRNRGQVEVELLAKDYSAARFAAVGLDYVDTEWADGEGLGPQVEAIIAERSPDVLLTSASSRPQDDMTEKLLWKFAADRDVPSLAVLDQWQNYIMRFSGPSAGERLSYMPSCVAVMDEAVRRDMVSEGFPTDRILVSGHPRFEVLHDYAARTDRDAARDKVIALGIEPDARIVTFVSEPARRFFAAEEGFDETSTLAALLDCCRGWADGDAIDIALKYHPRNTLDDFAEIDDPASESGLRLHHIVDEIEPWDLLLASDLVVGMISILLVDSVLLGIPTLSVQLNGYNVDRCIPSKYGAIAVAREVEELRARVGQLLDQGEFRRSYLQRQRAFAVSRDGIALVESKIYEFAGLC